MIRMAGSLGEIRDCGSRANRGLPDPPSAAENGTVAAACGFAWHPSPPEGALGLFQNAMPRLISLYRGRVAPLVPRLRSGLGLGRRAGPGAGGPRLPAGLHRVPCGIAHGPPEPCALCGLLRPPGPRRVDRLSALRGGRSRTASTGLKPAPLVADNRVDFDAAFPLGAYEGELREVVLRTKRLAHESLTRALGQLLAERAGGRWPDSGRTSLSPSRCTGGGGCGGG